MLTLVLAAGLTPPPAGFDEFRVEARQMVLAGEALPPDFLLSLSGLDEADRLLAVIYLRRAGLLTGPTIPLGRILSAGDRP